VYPGHMAYSSFPQRIVRPGPCMRRLLARCPKEVRRPGRCRDVGRRRLLIVLLALGLGLPGPARAAQQDLTPYANPLSGSLGAGFPMVGASAPFGLIQPGPDTGMPDGSEDPVDYCGYGYQDPTIRGFSLTHFDGAGIHIGGDLPFMPATGAPGFDAAQNASPYDHATETS